MPAPMSGLKVVDLTQGYEGYGAMMLAEFGASVTKVEPIQGDYMRQWGPPFVGQDSAAFMGVNRGKRSIALAWRENSEARQILQRLILQADVFISNLYPDEAESGRLDYNSLSAAHPSLIYCSLTPYGDVGPHSNRRGTELEVQGFAAQWRLVGVHGEPPVRVGVPIGAINGSVFAFQGITGALISRLRTGEGQKVDVAEIGAITSMRTITYAAESEPDEWIGHTVAPMRPPNRGYKTKDRNILWGFTGNVEAQGKFLEELGLGHLKNDPRISGGGGGDFGRWPPDLLKEWDRVVGEKPAQEVLEIAWKYGGSAVPYSTFETISKEPQALAMGMIEEFKHPAGGAIKTIGLPWSFSETPGIVGAPPLLGQHTQEVLKELGFSPSDVARLTKARIAAAATS